MSGCPFHARLAATRGDARGEIATLLAPLRGGGGGASSHASLGVLSILANQKLGDRRSCEALLQEGGVLTLVRCATRLQPFIIMYAVMLLMMTLVGMALFGHAIGGTAPATA